MKVMFISHVSNKLGAARSLLNLIDGLQPKGVECYVILPNQGLMEEELTIRGVKYSTIRSAYWVSLKYSPWRKIAHIGLILVTAIFITARAWKWQADILYTNTSVTPMGALAAFFLRKPHIWHIREFGRQDYQFNFDLGENRTLRIMEKLSFRVIVISKALQRKYAQSIHHQKLKMIYNAVPISTEAYPDTNDSYSFSESQIPTLVIVGIVHPGKGQMDAVLAVAILVRQGTKVNLKIVGNGDSCYLDSLKQAAVENHVQDNIEFIGYTDNPASIVNMADAVLVCSRAEAFGRVTIEGMLSSKPVIGARAGATPELVREGFNGLLYEPGNYRELANKIKYLIDHPEEAQQMGRNGFKWASIEFTVEKCAGRIFKVLQESIGSTK